MRVSQKNDFFFFILFILVDLWTQLCSIKQGIICHNASGLLGHSSQWMVALTVYEGILNFK